MRMTMTFLLGVMFAVFLAADVIAQELPAPQRELVVGTRDVPPFAMKSKDGAWSGIAIDLWTATADELGYTYTYRDLSLEEMLSGLADGSVDVVVAALTTTAEREAAFDFSQPFFSSGLGIAIVPDSGNLLTGILMRVFSMEFLQALAALMAVLLLVGAFIWFLERKRNPEHFGGPTAKGLASGFWWAGVTMTTVGYGDKAPATAAGRLVGMVWMFASVISISAFTAAIASSLALEQLSTRIHGPEDLPGNRVGTVEDSTSAAYLKRNRVRSVGYDSAEEALEDLRDGATHAVVYDAALLNYLISKNFEDTLKVLPQRFENQNYSIGLPTNSPLREPINRELLDITSREAWRDTLDKYLGTP